MATTVYTNEWASRIAKSMAERVVATKDWRVTTKQSKAFKALAAELLKSDNPYIVATIKELAEMYPGLYTYKYIADSPKQIWGIDVDVLGCKNGRVKFEFIPIKDYE